MQGEDAQRRGGRIVSALVALIAEHQAGQEPKAYLLRPGAGLPNHPHWPVLVYAQAVQISGRDPARAFEALFNRNGWPAAWRNGIHDHEHFHATAHEALGIYSGEVCVQLGGQPGVVLVLRAGDVVVLPAGTGHRRLTCKGRLGVVGAYPAGQSPDLCVPSLELLAARIRAVAAVPLPVADPVRGSGGGVLRHWLTGPAAD